ncbi:MAG: 1-pyrroline-5-carboxylate dehydrogenase [Myxococcales bacterium]
MSIAVTQPPQPYNEPVRSYAPGSPERASLEWRLDELSSGEVEVPLIVGGRAIHTAQTGELRMPHRRAHRLGVFHQAGEEHVGMAIKAALEARPAWEALPWEERAAVFLRAADLLSGPWRDTLNAATMLGQSKTAFQAEIDAACELADFWRYNAYFARELAVGQPLSPPGFWNRMEMRGLEGFVFAVTPFNFTAIAGNLPTAPALMGCTVVWKPAETGTYAAWQVLRLLHEAGLPEGVINFVPGDGPTIGAAALSHPELAGVHFTGSTATFEHIWRTVGENVAAYRSYPRLVGETGGKDFVLVHRSADVDAVVVALLRGAFEFQGQKCSAASRAYVPRSLWPAVRERLVGEMDRITMGDVRDLRNFMGAVIDERAFRKIKRYIDFAREAADATIVAGGGCDDREGWFVAPTLIETSNPTFKTMVEEIFGPVLTVLPYDDHEWGAVLRLVDESTPYGLTGSILARDRAAVAEATARLRHAAGNFYVNDKPTGAVVGQQPFGGGRKSGTNDKAGSALNLLRWASPRVIKETLVSPVGWRYPHMGE